jgi:hypothetical protein
MRGKARGDSALSLTETQSRIIPNFVTLGLTHPLLTSIRSAKLGRIKNFKNGIDANVKFC